MTCGLVHRPPRTCFRGKRGAGRPGRFEAVAREIKKHVDTLVDANELPLAGHRILVTAPRNYAAKLCSKLIARGAQPIWFPCITILPLSGELCVELDTALRSLNSYTHLAFTSRNGILAVFQRLDELFGDEGPEVLKSSGVRLCALGADGDLLKRLGLDLHISPLEASTQGLVRELHKLGEAKGAHVLCPVPLVRGGLTEPPIIPKFLSALQAAGAVPCAVPAYLTTLSTLPHNCEAERRLLSEGHISAIAFTSTAEAQGLARLLGGQAAVHEAVLASRCVLAAHGPYTARGVGDVLGCEVACVSQQFASFDGLVAALEGELGGRRAAGAVSDGVPAVV